MFFRRKKKDTQQEKVISKQEELVDILDIKEKVNNKLNNVPDEIVAKAIKDLLSKD